MTTQGSRTLQTSTPVERGNVLKARHPREPDYKFWASCKTWPLNDAVKLICGRDPNLKLTGPQLYNKRHRVIDIIDIAFDAVKCGSLPVVRNSQLPIHVLLEPRIFLMWALRENLTIPEELHDLAVSRPSNDFGRESLENTREAVLKLKAKTIAETLKFIFPEITDEDLCTHAAMKALLDESATAAEIRGWIDRT